MPNIFDPKNLPHLENPPSGLETLESFAMMGVGFLVFIALLWAVKLAVDALLPVKSTDE